MSKGQNEFAFALVEDLLNEVSPLTRVDVSDVLRWKGIALRELGRMDESYQVLTEARSLAEASGSNLHLWPVLAKLAKVNEALGNRKEAEANQAARKIVEQIGASLHGWDSATHS